MTNESDLIADARDVADSDAWAIVPRLADALEARRTEAAKLRGVAIAALSRIPVDDNTRQPIKAALAKGEWPADLLEAVQHLSGNFPAGSSYNDRIRLRGEAIATLVRYGLLPAAPMEDA